MLSFIDVVAAERRRQDKKWGVQNHTDEKWLAILVAEVGELAKEVLEGDPTRRTEELTHVAAVSAAWYEAIIRRSKATL